VQLFMRIQGPTVRHRR